MPTPARLATLLGASLLADALALPAHWIYEPEAIATRFGRIDTLLAPPEGSYHAGRPAGAQTHYGDQALVLMESLAAAGGFDAADFAARWRAMWDAYPGYRDGATRATLANLQAGQPAAEAGSGSGDLGGAARIAPLIVALANAPAEDQEAAALEQTMLTHRDLAVGDAAIFLTRAARLRLADVPLPAALAQAAAGLALAAQVEAAAAAAPRGATAAVQALGPACGVQGALPATLAIALAHPDDLEAALIANVMAGGDSAARGLALGILIGAGGAAEVPARWRAGWLAAPRVEAFLAGAAR